MITAVLKPLNMGEVCYTTMTTRIWSCAILGHPGLPRGSCSRFWPSALSSVELNTGCGMLASFIDGLLQRTIAIPEHQDSKEK